MPHSAENKPPETPTHTAALTRFLEDITAAIERNTHDADTLHRFGHPDEARALLRAMRPVAFAVMRLARATHPSDDEPTTTTKGARTNG